MFACTVHDLQLGMVNTAGRLQTLGSEGSTFGETFTLSRFVSSFGTHALSNSMSGKKITWHLVTGDAAKYPYTPSQSILLSRKVNVYLEGTLWRGRTRDRGSVLGAILPSAWWQVENQLYSSVWTDANIQTLWKGPSIGQRPRRCVAFFAMSLTSLT